MKRKRGRPKVKTDEVMETIFAARFNREETEKLNAAIKKSKKSKTVWIREKLLNGV